MTADPPDNDLTTILTRMEAGDAQAADELLPHVHEALLALARQRMAREPTDHTLQATALVNEAYLRLIGDRDPGWNGRGHFYGAAAEAMRRILVERARRVGRLRHGGDRRRVPLTQLNEAGPPAEGLELLALDEALTELEATDPRGAQVVMFRYFAGLSNEDTAEALGLTERTVRRTWSAVRLWLFDRVHDEGDP